MKKFRQEHNPALRNKQATEKAGAKDFDSQVKLSVNPKTSRHNDAADDAELRAKVPQRKSMVWDFKARGEPFLWVFGGGLCIGIAMIIGFIILIVYNGILTFNPRPIEVVLLHDGSRVAGEVVRVEDFRPTPEMLEKLSGQTRREIADHGGIERRILFRTGNFDLYNEDYKWVTAYEIAQTSTPDDMFFVERMEWGPFIGTVKSLDLSGKIIPQSSLSMETLDTEQAHASLRRDRISEIERHEIATINHYLEAERLKLKKVGLQSGEQSAQYAEAEKEFKTNSERLEIQYRDLAKEVTAIRERDAQYTITLADVSGREKTLKLSDIVRFYPANKLTFSNKVGIYLSRWWEFLTQEPREANTEGGVMPAIFGTFCMTILMALAVAPFGVIAALYLREYAKQGRLVSLVRICVNNLAGVPSIVYGVFGLGFFAYMVGANIDRLFFPERLPTPTYGTGGLLWASLTLALLTVPVVIVATEEALAAVPQSMREGSLACGASKWQTIKYIVLPRAMPGIMTGLILAMARGAGEVAPLMLVGVVKLAPELPIDHFFPYIHLDRSFMHLGFHIFDVGFQSRNSEAAKPMVYVTTLLLITLVFAMNAASIMIRNRLKRKFFTGHF
jgi:phosphate transport system permease protein